MMMMMMIVKYALLLFMIDIRQVLILPDGLLEMDCLGDITLPGQCCYHVFSTV